MRERMQALARAGRMHVVEVLLGLLVVGTLFSGAVQVNLFLIGLPPVLGPVLFGAAALVAVIQLGLTAKYMPLSSYTLVCIGLWFTYVTWALLSITWSVYTVVAGDKEIALLGYSTLFFTMGILLGRWSWSAASFRIGTAVLGFVTVASTSFFAATARSRSIGLVDKQSAIQVFADSYQATTLCLGMAATFALIAALGAKRRSFAISSTLLWGVLSLAMLAGGGRGAALACTAGQIVVILMAIALRDVGQNKKLAVGILLSLPVLSSLAVLLAMQLQLRTIERIMSFTSTSTDSSGRGDLWNLAIAMAEKRPIWGNGMGTFEATAHSMISPGMYPHNFVLEVLAETGFVGLAIFIAAYVAPCVGVLRRIGKLGFHSAAFWLAMLVSVTIVLSTSGTITDRFLVFILGLGAGSLMKLDVQLGVPPAGIHGARWRA